MGYHCSNSIGNKYGIQPHIMNFALFTMMLYPYFIANSLKKARISHVRNC